MEFGTFHREMNGWLADLAEAPATVDEATRCLEFGATPKDAAGIIQQERAERKLRECEAFLRVLGPQVELADMAMDQSAAKRAPTKAAYDVLAERRRQAEAEGWSPEHDDTHTRGELSDAASCYALHANDEGELLDGLPDHWPWEDEAWKRPRPSRSRGGDREALPAEDVRSVY